MIRYNYPADSKAARWINTGRRQALRKIAIGRGECGKPSVHSFIRFLLYRRRHSQKEGKYYVDFFAPGNRCQPNWSLDYKISWKVTSLKKQGWAGGKARGQCGSDRDCASPRGSLGVQTPHQRSPCGEGTVGFPHILPQPLTTPRWTWRS